MTGNSGNYATMWPSDNQSLRQDPGTTQYGNFFANASVVYIKKNRQHSIVPWERKKNGLIEDVKTLRIHTHTHKHTHAHTNTHCYALPLFAYSSCSILFCLSGVPDSGVELLLLLLLLKAWPVFPHGSLSHHWHCHAVLSCSDLC